MLHTGLRVAICDGESLLSTQQHVESPWKHLWVCPRWSFYLSQTEEGGPTLKEGSAGYRQAGVLCFIKRRKQVDASIYFSVLPDCGCRETKHLLSPAIMPSPSWWAVFLPYAVSVTCLFPARTVTNGTNTPYDQTLLQDKEPFIANLVCRTFHFLCSF